MFINLRFSHSLCNLCSHIPVIILLDILLYSFLQLDTNTTIITISDIYT